MNRTRCAAAMLAGLVAAGCGDECENIRQMQGDPIVGAFVYDNQCRQCHGAEGLGVSGPSLQERLPTMTICDIVQTVRSGPSQMPAYPESVISETQLSNLIEYMTLEFQ